MGSATTSPNHSTGDFYFSRNGEYYFGSDTAVARTVNGQLAFEHGARPELEATVARLEIDFAKHVRPTAGLFWSRIRKDHILDIARETLGAEWASSRSKHKKIDLARSMEEAFAAGKPPVGIGAKAHAAALAWTPPRFAGFEAGRGPADGNPAETAPDGGDATARPSRPANPTAPGTRPVPRPGTAGTPGTAQTPNPTPPQPTAARSMAPPILRPPNRPTPRTRRPMATTAPRQSRCPSSCTARPDRPSLRAPAPHRSGRGAFLEFLRYDNGREFCGRPDRHPHELFLHHEEIEHRTTNVQRP